jgi:hypothetical protein
MNIITEKNANRRQFLSNDYNLFDTPAKELWVQHLYEKGFSRVSSKENFKTPDVVAFKGLTKIKWELECRRNYDFLVWKSDFVTIPLKYKDIDDYRGFFHIVLDCEEVLSGKITRFVRIRVEDILKCEVIEKQIWSKKNQAYENEFFYQVPRTLFERVLI